MVKLLVDLLDLTVLWANLLLRLILNPFTSRDGLLTLPCVRLLPRRRTLRTRALFRTPVPCE